MSVHHRVRPLRRPGRRAACLCVFFVMSLGLFAFPTSAGMDPSHSHIVVGGTPAERARALASHLVREREGVATGESPAAPSTAGRPGFRVRVFSLRGHNDAGPAVLSLESGGAVLQTAIPHIPVPSQTVRRIACSPRVAPHTTVSTPDPPPRRA